MFDFIKRLFVRKRTYLASLKPCPCCGGRHILFKPAGTVFCIFINTFNRFVCDDCGFKIEHYHSDVLFDKWDRIPRKKEDNHD